MTAFFRSVDHTQEVATTVIIRACAAEERAFWGWTPATWINVIGVSPRDFHSVHASRTGSLGRLYVIAAAYTLGCFRDIRKLRGVKHLTLANRVFGPIAQAEIDRACVVLGKWGYSANRCFQGTVAEALLLNESPLLEHLTLEALERFRSGVIKPTSNHFYQLSRALVELGLLDRSLGKAWKAGHPNWVERSEQAREGVPAAWQAHIDRWYRTSTLATSSRNGVISSLRIAGRWLTAKHPDVTSPEQWTRELAAEFVATICRMKVGDYMGRQFHPRRLGEPLLPRTRASRIVGVGTFFADCQEWGWCSRRLDPRRAFAVPKTVRALIGPAPRTVADDIWAKLLWAGLNMTTEDLPTGPRRFYPLEMVRALALVWLFCGLRSDEIVRLRVGCVRRQKDDKKHSSATDFANAREVCLLEVPTGKTATEFTKPVDRVAGDAIEAWNALRPSQPPASDSKTGELVEFLFSYRAKATPKRYLNMVLIPLLCRKAGVPLTDARGSITTHRARSTIASQLYNAREPMNLFELQAWLGHKEVRATQNYVAITPTRLRRAYTDAGYFARNVRAIEVLIDQDALKQGAAATGEPWRYYDLGHGLCTYEFFDQCPHRMACARCDFYVPKDSSATHLLEAKSNVLHLLQEIPLSDDERAAAEGDLAALEKLTTKLSKAPTPSGPAPELLQIKRKRKSEQPEKKGGSRGN